MENNLIEISYPSKNIWHLLKFCIPLIFIVTITVLTNLFSALFISSAINFYMNFILVIILILGTLMFLEYIYKIKKKIPMIIIDTLGIHNYGLIPLHSFIPWNTIESISIKNVCIGNTKFNNMIVIKLKEDFKRKNLIYWINRKTVGGEFSYPNYIFENNISDVYNFFKKNSKTFNFEFNY